MSPPASVATAHPFGALLRQWRTARKMSQLALALEAGISARHLRGYPETTLGETVYLFDSERISPQQRSALLW